MVLMLSLSLSLSPCCLSATMLDHDRKKTIMKNIIYCDTWLGWAGLGWVGYRQIDDAGAIPTISATFRKEKLNSSFSAISSLILSSSPACLLLSLSSASLASRALLSDGVSSPSARNSWRENSVSPTRHDGGWSRWSSPGACRESRNTCCRCCNRPGACGDPSLSGWS